MFKRFIYHAVISVLMIHFMVIMALLIYDRKNEIPDALLYWQFILALVIFPVSAIYCFVRMKVEHKTHTNSRWLFIIGLSFPPQTLAVSIFIQQTKHLLRGKIGMENTVEGVITEKNNFVLAIFASLVVTAIMLFSDYLIALRNKKGQP